MISLNKYNLQHELEIRGIKIIDIIYVTTLNFIIGYYTTVALDKINNKVFGKVDDTVKYSKRLIMFQVLCQMALTGVLLYIESNMVAAIPFPLDGMNGYKHSKLSELAGRSLLGVFLITYQKNLQSRISYLQKTE
jgi:hypothetical protein